MCLYITNRSKRMTANKDIVVYKILMVDFNDENILRTPFQKAIVEIGETYSSKLDYPIVTQSLVKRKKAIILRGLHSYKHLKHIKRYKNLYSVTRIAKCIIPKGAEYYVGKFNDPYYDTAVVSYASTKLKYCNLV